MSQTQVNNNGVSVETIVRLQNEAQTKAIKRKRKSQKKERVHTDHDGFVNATELCASVGRTEGVNNPSVYLHSPEGIMKMAEIEEILGLKKEDITFVGRNGNVLNTYMCFQLASDYKDWLNHQGKYATAETKQPEPVPAPVAEPVTDQQRTSNEPATKPYKFTPEELAAIEEINRQIAEADEATEHVMFNMSDMIAIHGVREIADCIDYVMMDFVSNHLGKHVDDYVAECFTIISTLRDAFRFSARKMQKGGVA
ncbi:MAG: KilA-N domain-containing protein [Bacteroidales bacterium]|nr:KilA-N domain-containing protein [Candidatus Colimorpha merdihippi]